MNKAATETIIAFDWGTQKIGVAVGQRLTATASPLAEIPARDGIPQWQQIEELIQEWQPGAFVVGIPLNMDDTENESTLRARKFGNRLHGRYGLPWYGVDERLSSFAARKNLAQQARQTGVNPKKGRLLDSMAAVLILETWFSSQQQEP